MNELFRSPWKVVGLGEILWDVFPDKAHLGGAPANFARHAAALGADAFLVSALGDDFYGESAISIFNRESVDVSCVSESTDYPTGTVQVSLQDGQPSYDIVSNVAWDFCQWTDEMGTLATKADAVCFGTLFQRSNCNREVVKRFLRSTRPDCLRVLDVNLRQNFFSDELIRESLELANALKLNEDELAVVAKASGLDGEVSELLRLLLDQFDLRMVVLTQGSKGSVMTTATEQNFCPATNIQLVDAVGAGDSFTASVVMGMLYQTPIAQINKIANRIAASVCENAGAARPDVLKEIDVPWRKIE